MERPKDFDARVVAYLPGLRKLARKLVSPAEAEDLVSKTVLWCLEKWQNYRPGGGFWTWLKTTMRSLAQQERDRAKTRRSYKAMTLIPSGVEPNQEAHTDLRRAAKRLAGMPYGADLARSCLGYGIAEIANLHGISKQRASQRVAEARSMIQAAQ